MGKKMGKQGRTRAHTHAYACTRHVQQRDKERRDIHLFAERLPPRFPFDIHLFLSSPPPRTTATTSTRAPVLAVQPRQGEAALFIRHLSNTKIIRLTSAA